MNTQIYVAKRIFIFIRVFGITLLWLIGFKLWVNFQYQMDRLLLDIAIASIFAFIFSMALPIKSLKVTIENRQVTAPTKTGKFIWKSEKHPIDSMCIRKDFFARIQSSELSTIDGKILRISSIFHGFRIKQAIICELERIKNDEQTSNAPSK